MKLVRLYETNDGKQFTNKKEAGIHEIKMITEAALLDVLKISIRTGRVEAVVKEIVEEAVEVRRLLVEMSMKMPKKKAV